jgi:hypothetical protein
MVEGGAVTFGTSTSIRVVISSTWARSSSVARGEKHEARRERVRASLGFAVAQLHDRGKCNTY